MSVYGQRSSGGKLERDEFVCENFDEYEAVCHGEKAVAMSSAATRRQRMAHLWFMKFPRREKRDGGTSRWRRRQGRGGNNKVSSKEF